MLVAQKYKFKQECGPYWNKFISNEIAKPYLTEMINFVMEEKASGKIIYPKESNIFRAFALTPFEETKVIILGQDPYHGVNQAHGLSFSVLDGVPPPPSLVNIFKEINRDLGLNLGENGNLTEWALQGVLLLNSVLTVEQGLPGSHQKRGWEIFTDSIIKALSDEKKHLVFVLWGAYAQKKCNLIDENKHLILSSVHPSPLSAYRGFFGSNHFSKINEYLISHKKTPIDYRLP